MCVEWKSDWETAQEDMTAYKFMQRDGDHFCSPLPVDKRASQDGRPTGSVLTYRIGEQTVSDEPGIYCITSPVTLVDKSQSCMLVKIPKGTKYRRGRAVMEDERGNPIHLNTINALCIEPLREHKETYYPNHYYSTASTSSTTMTYSTHSISGATRWYYAVGI